eukprot:SAG22_NODE_35_length_27276_cov_20.395849_11_plen_148_part_00
MRFQQVGGVDVAKLPGPEALLEPGESDGKTKLVRTANGGAEAHSWSASDGRWVKIGDVVEGNGGGGGGGGGPSGGMVGDKVYDFVFDVDMEDGMPARKLGVNKGEDAMFAAHRFLDAEGESSGIRSIQAWDSQPPHAPPPCVLRHLI